MDLATAVDARCSDGVPREATGLLGPSTRPVSGVDWATAETTSHFALAERVAQAGAGVLLIAVGAAELILGGWESGPWQRSIALVFAAAGALVLAQAVINIARRAARAGCAGNADAALGPAETYAAPPARRLTVAGQVAARS